MSYELYGNLKGLGTHNYITLTTQLENNEINGFIMIDTVLQDIEQYQILYFHRKKIQNEKSGWRLANANSLNTMYCRAISIGSANAGELCPILIYGGLRNNNWDFDVYKTNLFVSNLPGEMTTIAPQEPGHIIQSIGIIEASNQAFFTFPPVWMINIEENN